MSPQGSVFNQKTANRLALYDRLIILCGHYEGVDQRIIDGIIDEVDYGYDGASEMPYSFDKLNVKLNDAYESFCEKYSYLQRMQSLSA